MGILKIGRSCCLLLVVEIGLCTYMMQAGSFFTSVCYLIGKQYLKLPSFVFFYPSASEFSLVGLVTDSTSETAK
jgi:hypothetical protein